MVQGLRSIIYMPYMPPFARREKLTDYTSACKPVEWAERHICSQDGTDIALAVGSIPVKSEYSVMDTVIVYFQGNGGSTPARLPLLSSMLKLLQAQTVQQLARYTVVALSYRGYWTSRGRASERGIKMDAAGTLAYVAANFPGANVFLWGQSIGAGVACAALADRSAVVIT